MMETMSDKLFAAVMIIIAAAWCLLGVATYQTYDNRAAYIEACETMGGVAVIGKMFTKICVKNESLIISE